MARPLHKLKRFIDNPLTQLATGLILLVSGLSTAYFDFTDADQVFRLGVHHGVALWALVQVLGSLPDVFEGIDRTYQVMEKRRES